jgi:hypothetical protein
MVGRRRITGASSLCCEDGGGGVRRRRWRRATAWSASSMSAWSSLQSSLQNAESPLRNHVYGRADEHHKLMLITVQDKVRSYLYMKMSRLRSMVFLQRKQESR